MNKTAENRRNAAESELNGGIEYSAFENMDRLAAIFAMQKLLNDDIAARRGLDFSVEEWEQRLVLAMISELSEVLDEVNFKWWKNKRPVNTEALQDELVDGASLLCQHVPAGRNERGGSLSQVLRKK